MARREAEDAEEKSGGTLGGGGRRGKFILALDLRHFVEKKLDDKIHLSDLCTPAWDHELKKHQS